MEVQAVSCQPGSHRIRNSRRSKFCITRLLPCNRMIVGPKVRVSAFPRLMQGTPMKLILKLLFLSTVMASFGLAQSARRIPVTLPTQVSQPEMQALLIHKVDPVYPPLAHQARVQGTVVLQIVIDKSGSVVNLQLVSGNPMLAPAAIEAVKQWKYQPYPVDGTTVEVQTQVQVNFSLSNQPIVGVIGSVASGYALPPPTPGVP